MRRIVIPGRALFGAYSATCDDSLFFGLVNGFKNVIHFHFGVVVIILTRDPVCNSPQNGFHRRNTTAPNLSVPVP